MESLLPTIISLASGALGGNVAGKLMPGSSLGTLGNSIAGIAGGGLGGGILSMLGMGGGGGAMEIAGILSSVAGGGVGGGVVMAVIGMIRKAMAK